MLAAPSANERLIMTSIPPNLLDLTGKTVLVTGAAGGIGAATAQLCAQHGARLVLVDILSRDEIAARVGDTASSAEIFSLNTSRRSDVEAMAAQVGSIYGLIDTAAIAPFDDWMAEDWEASLDRVIAVNVKGPINVTRAFLPGMIAQRDGRIILCGSVAGWMGGVRSGPHYAFSKGGIHAFTRWLSRQGAPHNVLVNAIAPGPVDTGMTRGQGYDPRQYPLGRMAEAHEIAAVAVFLCSAGATYISGAVVDVNGGVHFH
jgi:NAD(P)-dependent dehydrogenase (short-subunit alcohol dehydrogenase family)